MGDYTITVKDGRACTAKLSVPLSQPERLTLNLESSQDISCYNGSDGKIIVKAEGGVGPYTYSLNDATEQNDGIFSALVKGAYSVSVTDAHGCAVSQPVSVVLAQPAEPLNATADTISLTCFESADGQISVNASGGTLPYQYSIDESSLSTTNSFTGLLAGDHTVLVKDSKNCSYVLVVNVPAPAKLEATIVKEDINCYGEASGIITVNTTGGNCDYSYSLDGVNYQESNQFNNLKAGYYTVSVKDSKNCTVQLETELFNLYQPLSFELDAVEPKFCDDKGSITIKNIQGGKTPYHYSIDGVNYSSQSIYTDLIPGNYTIFVKDANGCIAIETIAPYGPVSIKGDYQVNNNHCFGDAAGTIQIINVTGGNGTYEYSLNGGNFQDSNEFKNLKAGDYQVVIRDRPYSCQSFLSVNISEPPKIVLTAVNNRGVSCKGATDGSIGVSATGGTSNYLYAIDDLPFGNSSIFNGIVAGKHTLHVQDSIYTECATAIDVIISSPEMLMATIAKKDVSCKGLANGSIQVNVTGGTRPYTYSLSGRDIQTSAVFENLSPNIYAITVTDKNACTVVVESSVTEPEILKLTVSIKHNTCYGAAEGKALLHASGGTAPYIYSKDKGITFVTDSVFKDLKAGTYTFTVKDAQGCAYFVEQIVTQTDRLILSADVQKVLCNGAATGIVTAKTQGGTGAYSYSLNNSAYQDNSSFQNLKAGKYILGVKDQNGCTASIPVVVEENTPVLLSTNFIKQISCYKGNDGEVFLAASGGTAPYQFSINGINFSSTSSFKNLDAKGYDFFVKDVNSCLATLHTDITYPEVLTLKVKQIRNVACKDYSNGFIELEASGGTIPYVYSINSASYQTSNVFNNLPPGQYKITVRDAKGCTQIVNITITDPKFLKLTLLEKKDVSCYYAKDAYIEVIANGGNKKYRYSLNGKDFKNSGRFENLNGGNYTIVVLDSLNCSSQISVEIKEPVALSLSKTVIQPKCYGTCDGEIILTATGGIPPYTYNWLSHPVFGNNSRVNHLCSGIYTVTVSDAKGCTVEQRINIVDPQEIKIEGLRDTILCKGQKVEFNAGNAGLKYSWKSTNGFASTASSVVVDEPGYYTLTVTNTAGCAVSKSFNVAVSSTLLKADFLVSSIVAEGDTVLLIDVSKPAPSKTLWDLPAGAREVGSNVAGTIRQIVFDKSGSYDISMTAGLGECADAVKKTITVLKPEQKTELNAALGYKEALLKVFTSYPNPTSGIFTAKVELSRIANIKLRLLSFLNNQLIEVKEDYGKSFYEVPFNHSELNPGMYVLVLELEGAVKVVKIIKI
ncbi:hypothetical protein [Rubrolithibacter danxiaensis]|uniref:hypothetical protein n=1 Tax=Rubrolithibacter danxiaensis TaxID=3390805 RepID=UPI003BF7B76E